MNTFKLQDLILEGRLEDVKKKYPNVNSETIDYLSQNDPSGNNKYLEWMVNNIVSSGYDKSRLNSIRDWVNGEVLIPLRRFHENINKITPELVNEVYQLEGWLELVKENSPAGKMLQKIIKTPKDINSYSDIRNGALTVLQRIGSLASEKLTKAEVKRLESDVLLNNQDLLILIPKSYKASCYYGAGTRWCTTSKTSDTYYNRYTSNGTLIYVIDKKSTPENPWYRTAFFIDKKTGDSQAFDAPDNPTSISVASKHLGDKWEIIRDTIIEYLHANNLKGIEEFYVGPELLSWLESKGLDPLKVMDAKKLINTLGYDLTLEYLKKRGIDIFTFFNTKMLFDIFVSKANSISEGVKELWGEFKKRDINPIEKLATSSYIGYVFESIQHGDIKLDDFLDQALKLNSRDDISRDQKNIFYIIEYNYGSGSDTVAKLLDIFKEPDLIFGFADVMKTNLFEILSPRTMRILIRTKFGGDVKKTLMYLIENVDKLRSSLSDYGFDNSTIIDVLDKETLNGLIEKDKLSGLRLRDYVNIYGNNIDTFWKFFDNHFGLNGKEEKWVDEFDIYSLIENESRTIKSIFPNIMDLQNAIRERVTKTFNIFDLNINYLFRFVDEDYYSLYKLLKEGNKLHNLNDLLLIKAYSDAPHDDTEIKGLVMEAIHDAFGQVNRNNYISNENGSDYVVTFSLCEYSKLFRGDYSHFLCDEINLNDFGQPSLDDIVNYLDNEIISKMVKEYLMVNFRGEEIELDMDWIDEFDTWAENIDDSNGTFTFTLHDERIMGMSDHKLEVIIMFSKKLRNIRNVLESSLKEAYKNILHSIVEGHFTRAIAQVLGDNPPQRTEIAVWSQSQRDDIMRSAYKAKYPNLLNDVMNYVDYFVWHEDELPSSIINMLSLMMREDIGRFEGRIDIDVDDIVNEHHPELHNEVMIEELSNILYDKLGELSSSKDEQLEFKPRRGRTPRR